MVRRSRAASPRRVAGISGLEVLTDVRVAQAFRADISNPWTQAILARAGRDNPSARVVSRRVLRAGQGVENGLRPGGRRDLVVRIELAEEEGQVTIGPVAFRDEEPV